MTLSLNNNPYLNWKTLDIVYKGKPLKIRIKAFKADICDEGVAYYIEVVGRPDRHIIVGSVKYKFYQLNASNPFTDYIGGIINHKVSEMKQKLKKEEEEAMKVFRSKK